MILNQSKSLINKQKKENKILKVILIFIKNNIKKYIIILLIFLIGIFLGVMFINNANQTQKDEINSYVNTYLETFKQNNINQLELLKNNIKENIILSIILWFSGSTIIGIPIVLGIIAFRGFCLGYTISACTYVLGTANGILFNLIALVLQNIIFIPAIISLGVSSLKLYQSILKDKRRENVKIEIIRHTIFSTIMAILLIVSAIIETKISTNLLGIYVSYLKK